MIAAALMLLAAPAEREAIGVWRSWGAFRDRVPSRCYAIARPIVAGGRPDGWASVANWPDRHLRGSIHIRLSQERDRSADVTVSVGERRFRLVADGRNAFAADTAADRAIVAAMRSGRSMSVEAVAPGGRPFADVYALSGAATAIDAAALACAGR